MKKYISMMITLMLFLLTGCGSKDDTVKYMLSFNNSGFESEKTEYAAGEDVIVRTYDVTDPELAMQYISEGRLVTMVRYYELFDGTWKTDDHEYKYRLEITGRMGGAAKDSTFVYLSNIEDISFERAYMAAGLSSNMDDYFDPEEAVLVAMN